jgi:phosphoenolpyruvate carboxykinase (ATP)
VRESGTRNAACGVEASGLKDLAAINWNFGDARLFEEAVLRKEGVVASTGAFTAETGIHTGRSPRDKHTVKDEHTVDQVWWGNNNAMSPEHFDVLYNDMIEHAKGRELFAQDLYGSADPAYRVATRVFTEYAWHSLFIRNLLIRPTAEQLATFVPDLTIIDLPSFSGDPKRHGCRSETVIAVNFTKRIILIGGTSYAGEMKKSVFTYLNYILPPQGVVAMHCSANVGKAGDTALFFGLSGTGKTTLSTDPDRELIGDDEHGWGDTGVFNFEGGCYAKTINLSKEAEPEIYAATERFGAVLENVPVDPDTRVPDYTDESKTENTRSAYPIHFIANAKLDGRAPQPKNLILLTADAFGVLPPIAKLTPAQAMYHFISGYTAKVAGTEKGVTEPEATFSTCFASPFLPRHPSEYGNLLRDLIARYDVDCWLINTGWTGGKFGVGRRMPIKVTRTLLAAALDGSLKDVGYRTDRYFGFQVPTAVPGVEPHILYPIKTWKDKSAFDATARHLIAMFQKNFEQFATHVDPDVNEAAPVVREAAE